AAAIVEKDRINKRKTHGGRRGFKVAKAEAARKDDAGDGASQGEHGHHDDHVQGHDDDGDVDEGAPAKKAPKRNGRLNKLMKKGGDAASSSNANAAPKKEKAPGAKNSKPHPPKVSPQKSKASSKRLERALKNFEYLKKEDLPGLHFPDELKKQSFTAYESGMKEKRGSSTASGIGIILRAESFYVKQVLQHVEGAIQMDGKGKAMIVAGTNCTSSMGFPCAPRYPNCKLRQCYALVIHLIDFMTEFLDHNDIKRSRDLDAVEMFCGVASIVKAFRQGYDRGRDEVLECLILRWLAMPWLWKLYQKLTPEVKDAIKKRKRLSDHEMVKDPGGDWSHADLATLKTFLEEAITEGDFHPNGDLPFALSVIPLSLVLVIFIAAETLGDNAFAETQLDEPVGDQKPSVLSLPETRVQTTESPGLEKAPKKDALPSSKSRRKAGAAKATAAKESQGNGTPKQTISSEPPALDQIQNGKGLNQEPQGDLPAQATAKESRGNESPKQPISSDPPGPKSSAPVVEQPPAGKAEGHLVAHGRGEPKHVDSQETLPMHRGHSVVSEFQKAMLSTQMTDPVLDMAQNLRAQGQLGQLQMVIPNDETCLDMQQSPGKLCEWVYRHGDAEASTRAFEVLKWTRLVAGKYDGAFEAQDSGNGPCARELHDTCLSMLSLQKEYEEAKAQFLKCGKVIVAVGSAKKMKEQEKQQTAEVLKSKMEQIDKWVSQKLDEKDLSQQEVCKKLDEHIATFSEALLKLLRNAETEFQSTSTSLPEDDESALCKDLENQLNMQLQEEDMPPAASVPGNGDDAPPPPKTSWQQQGVRAAMQRLDTSEIEAAVDVKQAPVPPAEPSAPALQKVMKPEPDREFKTEEERLAWEAKEAKRLKHNARVRFDSPDCPPIVLDKLGELEGQPNRLKTLAVWFQQWLEAGEDWANTQLVIEATRVNQENYAAKEVMKSFKTLCDQYGKKVAEGIRQRKYAKEKSRDPRVDPKPYHMEHPDGIEDVLGMLGAGRSNSAESLTGGEKNPNKAERGKVSKVAPNSVARTEKAKANHQEELDKHKNAFTRIKGELEGLYSIHNNTKDADMSESVRNEINGLIERSDSLVTTFSGAMKPLKMILEPLRQIEPCTCMYMKTHMVYCKQISISRSRQRYQAPETRVHVLIHV
ncbi:unnamed protein product, partial [Symbiodinium necroappetens]